MILKALSSVAFGSTGATGNKTVLTYILQNQDRHCRTNQPVDTSKWHPAVFFLKKTTIHKPITKWTI
ncbi:MAG: hypothetical protein LBH80_04850 [Prevotellaceae bacterium]|nr:hypothetical protein [Prevotellaceae bacterium]